jgi:hypothetical protein
VLTSPPHAETGWGELAPLPHTRQKEEQAGEFRSRLIRSLKWDIISAVAELGCAMAGEVVEAPQWGGQGRGQGWAASVVEQRKGRRCERERESGRAGGGGISRIGRMRMRKRMRAVGPTHRRKFS